MLARPDLEQRELQVGTLRRSYLLHTPTRMTPHTHGLPLVIVLHGAGGTGRLVAMTTNWCAIADEGQFIVAFPDATPTDLSKPQHFRANPQVWVDLSGRARKTQGAVPLPPGSVDDVAFINALLDALISSGSVDPSRVYMCGFSSGASMAFAAAGALASRIAAIAPVAGACWCAPSDDSWAPALPGWRLPRGVPMLYITGDADTLNPIAGGPLAMANGTHKGFGGRDKPPVEVSLRRWARWVGADDVSVASLPAHEPLPAYVAAAAKLPRSSAGNGSDRGITVRTFPPRSVAGAAITYVELAGHGHVWPGGRSTLPAHLVGRDSGALDASSAIWGFFRSHALPAAVPEVAAP